MTADEAQRSGWRGACPPGERRWFSVTVATAREGALRQHREWVGRGHGAADFRGGGV